LDVAIVMLLENISFQVYLGDYNLEAFTWY